MNQLEYVASGTGYCMLIPSVMKEQENFNHAKRIFEEINSNIDHKFSFLYNAYTEKEFGEFMNELKDAESIHNIYADSGGLQAITRGMNITDNFKIDVYRNQAKYSTKAMSFDEIPVETLGGKSSKTDLNTRFFSHDMLEGCAAESGRNLRKQIELFVENKTQSQPIFIIQGNCYDTYMKWTEYAIAEIPEDLREFIGGVAISDTASGFGVLQDIRRAFYYTCLPWKPKNNHIHLLGVGAIKRMLPNIIFFQNGIYKDMWVSYDSTSHTSGVSQGRYFNDKGKMIKLGKYFNPKYHALLEDFNKKFPFLDYDIDTLFKGLSGGRKENDYNGLGRTKRDQLLIAFGSLNIYNFILHFENISQSKEDVLTYLSDGNMLQKQSFRNLYEVKDFESFMYWEKHCKAGLSYNNVQSKKPATLDI